MECRVHSHPGLMALVDQTYSSLLGLQPAAPFQPTGSTQHSALDAVLADMRFHVAVLALDPLDDTPMSAANSSLDDTAVLPTSDASVAGGDTSDNRRAGVYKTPKTPLCGVGKQWIVKCSAQAIRPESRFLSRHRRTGQGIRVMMDPAASRPAFQWLHFVAFARAIHR